MRSAPSYSDVLDICVHGTCVLKETVMRISTPPLKGRNKSQRPQCELDIR